MDSLFLRATSLSEVSLGKVRFVSVVMLFNLNFKGEFGVVYKAILRDEIEHNMKDFVAVKTLKGMDLWKYYQ